MTSELYDNYFPIWNDDNRNRLYYYLDKYFFNLNLEESYPLFPYDCKSSLGTLIRSLNDDLLSLCTRVHVTYIPKLYLANWNYVVYLTIPDPKSLPEDRAKNVKYLRINQNSQIDILDGVDAWKRVNKNQLKDWATEFTEKVYGNGNNGS